MADLVHLVEVRVANLVVEVLAVVAVLGATVIQVIGFLVQDHLEGGFQAIHPVKIDMADQALGVLAPLVQVIQVVDLVDHPVDLTLAGKVVLADSVVLIAPVVLEILGRVNLAHLGIVVVGIEMIEKHFNFMKYHNML